MQNDTKCYPIAYIHGMLHSSLHKNKPFFLLFLHLGYTSVKNKCFILSILQTIYIGTFCNSTFSSLY